MTQPPSPSSIEPYDPAAVEDYRQQAQVFLGRSREYLAVDDLHQASEKGWGAAAWMAKAVALRQGWEYRQHAQFSVVMYNASLLLNNSQLTVLGDVAEGLHRNYYTRKRFLIPEAIARNLDRVAELVDFLEPLTEPVNGQADC